MKRMLPMLALLLGVSLATTAQSPANSRCPVVNIVKTADTLCFNPVGGVYYFTAAVTGSNLRLQLSTSPGAEGNFGGEIVGNQAQLYYAYTAAEAGRGYWLYVTAQDTLSNCRPATDSLFLQLNDPASVSIDGVSGNDELAVACSGEPISLSASISGTASSVSWRSNGTGYFSNLTTTSVVYHASKQDRRNGIVQITATTNDPAGPCTATGTSAFLIFTDGYIEAGSDVTVCGNTRAGLVATNSSFYNNFNSSPPAVQWTSNGTGRFVDPTEYNTSYNFTTQDIANGLVALYLSVTGDGCATYRDTQLVTFEKPLALSFPRSTVSACGKGASVNVAVVVPGTLQSGRWTSSGDGNFVNPAALSTVYVAGARDYLSRAVNLSFTARNSCGTASGTMVASFKPVCVAAKLIASNPGIDDVPLAVAPNPATNRLQISTRLPLATNRFQLMDVSGQSIPCKWAGNRTLDIAGLPSGVYFLKAHTDSGLYTVKFMKL